VLSLDSLSIPYRHLKCYLLRILNIYLNILCYDMHLHIKASPSARYNSVAKLICKNTRIDIVSISHVYNILCRTGHRYLSVVSRHLVFGNVHTDTILVLHEIRIFICFYFYFLSVIFSILILIGFLLLSGNSIKCIE
jgi:hypothetical protein